MGFGSRSPLFGFNDSESSRGGLLLKTVAAAAPDGSSSSQGHTVPLLQEMADMDSEIDVPLLLDQVEDNRSEQTLESPTEDELGVESLDYDPIHSFVFSQQRRAQQRRHFYGYTGLTLAKWSITIMIGILVGIVAYVIESSQEVIISTKKQWTEEAINQGLHLALVFFIYASFGISLVLFSSCLVLFWAPAAAGGGVTLVMAYLNGNDIPDFFQLRTLITKCLGTICTISSGLPIGQEGPMVHIGAAIASSLTWMHGRFPTKKRQGSSSSHSSRLCCDRINQLSNKAFPFDFHNDKDRREFISAGTAAGLAAAFGAPIGGVLFSLEEASSFWSRKVMWRSLLCTSCATMVLSWLNKRDFSLSLPGSLSFHGLRPEFSLDDLPLFVVTSGAAGLLGACLNTAHGWLSQLRPSSRHRLLRIIEACSITFIAVGAIFSLPHFFGHCLEIQKEQEDEYWFRYTCPGADSITGVGYYNDLATLFFSVPHQSIQRLLALGSTVDSYFTVQSLCIHWMSFLGLFILAYGIATPGGIFMPSIMVGASFGAFLGRIFQIWLPSANVQPGLHALVGATAMLGGVFRSSISLVVIMVEGTGGIDFILPVILAIVISNWVAHHIHHAGAYEADLERLGEVCFLPSEPPHKLIAITAGDIMAPGVICFNEIVSVAEVVKVLRETQHNGFPVIRRTESDGCGQLVGLILRHQILLLLEQRALMEVDSQLLNRHLAPRISSRQRVTKEQQFYEHAMRVYHHSHYPHRRYLSSRPEALDELDLDEILQEAAPSGANGTGANGNNDQHTEEANNPAKSNSARKTVLALDLRPYMNRAPLTVRGECSAQRVFIIFRTLGLRHLCVTDSSNRVIGMITRKDIGKAQQQLEQSEGKFVLERQESDGSAFFGDRTNRDVLFSLP
ncbi:hypothetical protein BDL97_12G033100 [Sphagnum fallax]|nr:hypothetical protein BDL97_12G033100 [Sphagnum fallax]KAH8945274.1 hypothetical protein BDL97_12G033100 [Sphagnum fallax]